jgi:hypothetical protein
MASSHDKIAARCRSHKKRNQLPRKRGMARSAILSITKSIGSFPSVPPFGKGGQGDFEIDFLRSYSFFEEL